MSSTLTLNGLTIDVREDGFINGSSICKANAKSIKTWLNLSSVQTLISAQRIDQQKHVYVHPDIVVQLAQWVSPEFSIQVSQWLRGLGNVNANSEIIYIATTPSRQEKNMYSIGGCKSYDELKDVFRRASKDEYFCARFWSVKDYLEISGIVAACLIKYKENDTYHLRGDYLEEYINFIIEKYPWFGEHFPSAHEDPYLFEPVQLFPQKSLCIFSDDAKVEVANITDWDEADIGKVVRACAETRTLRPRASIINTKFNWGRIWRVRSHGRDE